MSENDQDPRRAALAIKGQERIHWSKMIEFRGSRLLVSSSQGLQSTPLGLVVPTASKRITFQPCNTSRASLLLSGQAY